MSLEMDDFRMWDDPIIKGPKRHFWQFRLKRADARRDQAILNWWRDVASQKAMTRAFREYVAYSDSGKFCAAGAYEQDDMLAQLQELADREGWEA
jgi:ATP-dependent exoDNAse (exonuclease V) beta subunit